MRAKGAVLRWWAGAWTVTCALSCSDAAQTSTPEPDARGNIDGGAEHARDASAPPHDDASRAPSSTAADSGSQSSSSEPVAEPGSHSDEDAGTTEPQLEPKYSVTDPLEVSLEIAPADWEALRREGRSLPAAFSGCADPAFQNYRDFSARLRLSGQSEATEVQVHKKGYIGSISMFRPSLSVEFPQGVVVAGFKRLTLNNNREDATNARQCLAYELYVRAGLPAPRCGLARVTVNGESKGYFTNVEPIKKPFLRRVFGEDEGNLYELEAPTDLSLAQADRIELKTNEARGDRSDLQRLLEALGVPDDQLIAALEPLIDLDQYLTHSALEALIGQWDGLSGHGTNAFLYHAVRDGRFHPIPWGADAVFIPLKVAIGDGPVAAFTSTLLGKRLYDLPEWRARYRKRLQELLDTLWVPDALLERLHQISQLTAAPASAIAVAEQFIQEQRGALERELSRSESLEPRVVPIPGDCEPPTAAHSNIELTWNATPREGDLTALLLASLQLVPGNIDLALLIRDQPIAFVPGAVLGAAGVNTDGLVLLATTGVDAATLRPVTIALFMPLANYRPGTVEFHGYETYGLVSTTSSTGTEVLGFIGEGAIRFDAAGPNTGDAIAGEWHARVAANVRKESD